MSDMMESNKQEKSISIVMMPYLAHGHVSPFYELAKKLSNKELVIYDVFQPWAAEAARELNIEAVLFITGVQSQRMKSGIPKVTESNNELMDYLFKNSVNGMTSAQRFLKCITSSSGNMVLIKSSTEIQAKFGKPADVFGDVVPVGPLVQRTQDHDGDEKRMDWLNKKETSSVAMMYGVPIIAIPLKFDQPLNANLVVDMGVAIEVPARREKRITRQEVAKAIKKVVVEEQGKEVRRRAKEMTENWKKKEDEEFHVAVEKLLQLVQQSKN
ncbi:hypothetical protein EZV62_002042 [Acer yangbiense]|uniref:Uncharacterized protein n=1 Tax=Acer yangbiense TaxID=1000413 RepID=A0A5C7IW59_9ROSI|nr:hypothetical protein EZV62_002042 [Acer yangbiense]